MIRKIIDSSVVRVVLAVKIKIREIILLLQWHSSKYVLLLHQSLNVYLFKKLNCFARCTQCCYCTSFWIFTFYEKITLKRINCLAVQLMIHVVRKSRGVSLNRVILFANFFSVNEIIVSIMQDANFEVFSEMIVDVSP